MTPLKVHGKYKTTADKGFQAEEQLVRHLRRAGFQSYRQQHNSSGGIGKQLYDIDVMAWLPNRETGNVIYAIQVHYWYELELNGQGYRRTKTDRKFLFDVINKAPFFFRPVVLYRICNTYYAVTPQGLGGYGQLLQSPNIKMSLELTEFGKPWQDVWEYKRRIKDRRKGDLHDNQLVANQSTEPNNQNRDIRI